MNYVLAMNKTFEIDRIESLAATLGWQLPKIYTIRNRAIEY